MKRLIYILLGLLIFSAHVKAEQTSYLITDAGTSADMIGRGYVEGFDRSTSGLFQNPASLKSVEHMSFSTFHFSFFENELHYQVLSGALKTDIGTK